MEQAAREYSERPFSVLLDLRWLVPGMAGGVEFYARSLVSALSRQDRSNRYTLLVPASSAYDFDLRYSPNFRRCVFDSFPRSAARLFRRGMDQASGGLRGGGRRGKSAQKPSGLPDCGAEIAHSFIGHISRDVEFLPNVLSVMDIQQEYMPEIWSERELRIRDEQYPSSAVRAARIITLSEHTRQTLIETYGVRPEKVVAIPGAADEVFFSDVPEPVLRDVKRSYGLPEGFLFFPAHTWPHKNHLGLLEALRILEQKRGLRPALCLTGGERQGHPAVLARVEELGLGARVRFLGFCPRGHMPALYRLASMLVYPSLFEGFGIPVLEAMASGCPVASSNRTSLPEVYGDCAEEFDPADHEAIAEAVWRLLSDPGLARELANRGRERARRFTWREAAWRTAQVYHEVARENRKE